jgi:hypothetical protein
LSTALDAAPRARGLAFYISGHGFGHASRQIAIINSLHARLPGGAAILIRTSAPRWLFDKTLTAPALFLEGACDTGVVQIDSLRLDERATAKAAADFHATFEQRAAAEAALLREHGVELIIADAPPLACAAAAAAGIPSIVVSNFTWDWIYQAYGEAFDALAPGVIAQIAQAYGTAAAGWRLPLHGGFESIETVLNVPFVARRARHAKEEVFDTLRIPADRPVVLSSFGGYGVHGFDHATLDCLDRWTVLVTGRGAGGRQPRGLVHVNEDEIYAAGLRYEDLVAAVDVVATKPGYGIISECVANGTAMLYTSRGRFAEYDVMVREMPRYLRCQFLEQEALLAGRWGAALDSLLASPPPPERPRTDGAEIVAVMLAAFLSS